MRLGFDAMNVAAAAGKFNFDFRKRLLLPSAI
jgi:hypothetical protein